MQFGSLMGSGLTDPAGLKADNLPISIGIAHIDPRVAVAAAHLPVRGCGLNVGQRRDHGGGPVEAHLAVGNVEESEMNAAGAKALQGFIAGLKSARCRDAHVIRGQQRIHYLGVCREHGVAPFILKLIDIVAALVLLREGHRDGGDRANG